MTRPGATAWLNGEIVHPHAASIAVDDHGLVVGDGIFETMLVRAGRACFWDRHLARLARSFAVTGIPPVPESHIAEGAAAALKASGLADARLRVTVTSGSGPASLRRGPAPTVVVTVTELGTAPGPARVVRVRWVRNERSILAGVKTTSYAEGAAIASRLDGLGADDVLLPDSSGRLSEALTANVFAVVDDQLVTPGLAAGCLPGIVRELLIEAGEAVERDIDIDDLDAATEMFLTSSVVGVRPVATLDGTPLPFVDGPATRRARVAFARAEARDAASGSRPH